MGTATTSARARSPRGSDRRLAAAGLGSLAFVVALVAIATAAQDSAPATQPAKKVLAIRAGWVLTLEGDGLGALENAVVLIEDGKVKAVGAGIEIPAGADVIEAPDATVAPGLFDARSALPLDPLALQDDRPVAPTFDVLDAVDPFAKDAIEEALRNGVTAVHCGPGRLATVGGRTAVLKLKPGRPARELVVRRNAAMRGAFGSSRAVPTGPIARLGEVRNLREQLRGAKKYREAWNDFREARKEYEEERAKRFKEGKGAGEKGAESREAENRTDDSRNAPPRGRRRPPRDAEEETAEDAGKDGNRRGTDASDDPAPAESAAPLQESKEADPKKGAEEKKEEPLKRPDRPAFEPDKESLLDVLDRKLPLRVEAHRAEDILNAIGVAKEFDLDLVIEGGTEAPRVAAEIAAAGVPVVLGPPLTGGNAPPEFEANDPGAAARLAAAGVRIAIGSSGTDATETRSLVSHAALASSAGLDPVAALRAITIGAARVCGAADRLGSIAPGKDGDLAVFDGNPLSTGARVRLVIVDGEVVWRR